MSIVLRTPRAASPSRAGWTICDERHAPGISRMRAQLRMSGYCSHSHDTYTLSLVESGVQEFSYRGSVHRCMPGQISVLHPDEVHDGRPGTREHLSYKCLYLSPSSVQDAIAAAGGPKACLPFIGEPVLFHAGIRQAFANAFEGEFESMFADGLVACLASLLTEIALGRRVRIPARRLDVAALDRAAQFLRANAGRVVHSRELETVTGLTRFELAAQFRRRFGTSPYRYLQMRRLDLVCAALAGRTDLAEIAQRTGFADQSHMGRVFRAAFGMTPGQFAQSHRS